MIIEKSARRVDGFRRPYRLFPSARRAFREFLRAVCKQGNETVLLPSYVGWSAREGSGVFDPVRELGLPFAFYRMDDRLHIDVKHLDRALRARPARVVVLIHYFGFVDPSYDDAVSVARSHGALVLEDEAHAMLTDLVGGASGRLGDASIFSLPKLLPVAQGGALLAGTGREHLLETVASAGPDLPSPWEYDLRAISIRRIENYRILTGLLRPLSGIVDPLRGDPAGGEVPQTYPLLLRGLPRDSVYFSMNEAGYGVVSLYHTLIEPIAREDFPESHDIAGRVLNLPVHQDVAPSSLEGLVERLAAFASKLVPGGDRKRP